jgi:hypothetical protein
MQAVGHLVGLEHGQSQQLVGWGGGQGAVLVGGQGAEAVAGLGGDHHAGAAGGDHGAELLQQHGGAVQVHG